MKNSETKSLVSLFVGTHAIRGWSLPSSTGFKDPRLKMAVLNVVDTDEWLKIETARKFTKAKIFFS
jgi:hypothetical protein